ncbi:flippase [Methanocella arvoryzae]|nr:flippase [Methanocella arvoryzae]
MGNASVIIKNTTVLLAAQFVNMLLSFLYIAYTARYLETDGFGVINVALSVTTILGVIVDLGINSYITREVSRDKALVNKFVTNILVLKLALAIIFFLALLAYVLITGTSWQTSLVVCIFGFSTVFLAITAIFNSIFQAFEKIEYQSVGSVLGNLLLILGALFAINQNFDVVGYSMVYFTSNLIVVFYCLAVYSLKFARFSLRIDPGFIRSTLKETVPFALGMFYGTIYYYAGSVMLSLMKGDSELGIFSAAYRLFLFILFIPQVFSMSLFPAMSRFFVTSADHLNMAFFKYLKYMAMVGIPMAIGGTLLADNIILFVFKEGYVQSIIVLQIIIWAALFIFLSSAYGCLFMSTNRQKTTTNIAGVCMLVYLALNIILIDRFSYVGLAWSTMIAEFVSMALYFILSYRIGYGLSREILVDLIKVAIASLIMGAFVILVKSFYVFAVIAAAIVLYTAILYILGCIDKDDIALVKSIITTKIPMIRKALRG